MSSLDNVIDFFNRVLPTGHRYFFSSIDPKTRYIELNVASTPSQIIASPNSGRNEYFSPAGYRIDANQRIKTNVVSVKTLWADFDPSEELGVTASYILAQIDQLSLPPTIVVNSGRGIQAYWTLPVPVTPTEWEAMALGLRYYLIHTWSGFGIDTSQWNNVAALMRFPQTTNQKSQSVAFVVRDTLTDLTNDQMNYLKGFSLAEAYTKSNASPKSDDTHSPDYKASYSQLLSSCNLLYACASQPNTVPEPLWYRLLGVLHGTKEGVDAAHEFSRNYTGYSFDETENKFRQWENRVQGIATCRSLQDVAGSLAAHCRECRLFNSPDVGSPLQSLKGQAGSPIALNQALSLVTAAKAQQRHQEQLQQQQAAATSQVAMTATDVKSQTPILEIDNIFLKVARINEILMPDYVLRVTGRKLSVEQVDSERELFSGTFPLPIRVYAESADSPPIAVTFAVVSASTATQFKPFTLSFSGITDCGTDVQKTLKAVMVAPPSALWTHVGQMIAHFVQLMREANAVEMCFGTDYVGWTNDNNTIITPTALAITVNSVRDAYLSNPPKGILHRKIVQSINSLSDIDALANKWFVVNQFWASTPTGRIAMLTAFAGPLVQRFMSSITTIVNLSGRGGVFKTTACRAALSAWGAPEDMMSQTDASDSFNGITAKLESLRHIPICIDEITQLQAPKLGKLIATVSNNKSKTRRASTGSYELIDQPSWLTLVLTTSNTSVTDMLRYSQAPTSYAEGSKRRYLEFVVPALVDEEYKKTADHVSVSDAANKELWGVAGPSFIARVLVAMSEFTETFTQHKKLFNQYLSRVDFAMNNQIQMVALFYTVAEYLTKWGMMAFDAKVLFSELVSAVAVQAKLSNCLVDRRDDPFGGLLPIIFTKIKENGNLIAHLSRSESKYYSVIQYSPTEKAAYPIIICIYQSTAATAFHGGDTVTSDDTLVDMFMHYPSLVRLMRDIERPMSEVETGLRTANEAEGAALIHYLASDEITIPVGVGYTSQPYSVQLVKASGVKNERYVRIPRSVWLSNEETE